MLLDNGEIRVTKAAIDPVWHLPGVAARFGVAEPDLRRTLFEETGGMFPELVTRPDLEVLLPPIGGTTVYFFGEVERIAEPGTVIACRVHDECNGSDVFGSDICTCRPYLVHGIEVCVETAQQGGVGIIVYNRKEGRALGEVTKFLVYNARKRQPGGDTADTYFRRTECVAGVQDMRFQELMPDVFHWLGIRRIDRWVSMSNVKRDALEAQGIEVVEQLAIPDRLVPLDAAVEIEAKKAAGYFAPSGTPGSAASCAAPKAVPSTSEAAAAAERRRRARPLRDRVGGSAERGETRHFRLVPDRLDEAVRRVVDITRRRYPDLDGPPSQPLAAFFGRRSRSRCPRRARRRRGRNRAGADRSRHRLGPARRRRGTALALSRGGDRPGPVALRGPGGGEPARDAGRPLFRRSRRPVACRCRGAVARSPREDARRARSSTPPGIELVGLEGRALLLRRLGEVCAASPALFGAPARLGRLYDYWSARGEPLTAAEVLRTLLQAFGADLARPDQPRGASRSAIAAVIPRCPATGSCRFISSASGSPIR